MFSPTPFTHRLTRRPVRWVNLPELSVFESPDHHPAEPPTLRPCRTAPVSSHLPPAEPEFLSPPFPFKIGSMENLTPRKARYDFTAVRDEAGVPHVTAVDWQAAIYALGYLHAIDRPTQIYFARAVAAGRAAERIAAKPELVEMDLFLRRAGLDRRIDEEVEALEPRIRDQLTWY